MNARRDAIGAIELREPIAWIKSVLASSACGLIFCMHNQSAI